MAYVASRRITLHLLLRYRRVMAYVASRRIILLLLCLVGRVMPYMASRRITLLLHQIMTLCCCFCFALSVASWPTWRRVA